MYQKCVCFIFLVILAILSCSGFRIDNLAMTDLTKKNFQISTRANSERYFRDDRSHRIRHHRLWRSQAHNRYPNNTKPPQADAVVYPQSSSKSSNNNKLVWPYNTSSDAKESVYSTGFPDERLAQIAPTDGGAVVSRPHRSQGSQRHTNTKTNTKTKTKGKGKRPWLPHQPDDLFTKAYKARFVIAAKLESKGSCSYYVEVKKDFKGNVGKEFYHVNKAYKRMLNGNCDLVRRMDFSKKYLLLLNETLGLIDKPKPMRKFRRSIKRLKRVCKPGFEPTKPVVELREIEENKKKEPRRRKLVCSVKGFPPPKITWRRRNEVLHDSSSFKILYKRRQSKLEIKKADAEHFGQYYCIAENAKGETTTRNYTFLPPPSESDKECKEELKAVFCSNGGTCFFEPVINEPSCICPEGFTGRRCDEKTPSNTSMYPQPDLYSCKLGLATKYNCKNN
ncbi:unnamed protein product [Phyllotreta striolata]|uniref:Uncharacterized protein n=1 Tax=Phyllotreta striolata TaxID=444603 RepID=A0A9N9U059_PHYSR|nr:unnamed protein product [Phyllotreta striolata]